MYMYNAYYIDTGIYTYMYYMCICVLVGEHFHTASTDLAQCKCHKPAWIHRAPLKPLVHHLGLKLCGQLLQPFLLASVGIGWCPLCSLPVAVRSAGDSSAQDGKYNCSACSTFWQLLLGRRSIAVQAYAQISKYTLGFGMTADELAITVFAAWPLVRLSFRAHRFLIPQAWFSTTT